MPRAPKACGRDGCAELVVARTYCPAHEPAAWRGAGHRGVPRALRRQVLEEEPRCRDCGRLSEEAGHIVARALGGRDVRENLKGQCRACNVKQIQSDKKRIARK